MLPISLSAYPFCQGARYAVKSGSMPRADTVSVKTSPNFKSRSRIGNLGGATSEKAFRNCWVDHCAVGCAATLKWMIRRLSWERMRVRRVAWRWWWGQWWSRQRRLAGSGSSREVKVKDEVKCSRKSRSSARLRLRDTQLRIPWSRSCSWSPNALNLSLNLNLFYRGARNDLQLLSEEQVFETDPSCCSEEREAKRDDRPKHLSGCPASWGKIQSGENGRIRELARGWNLTWHRDQNLILSPNVVRRR